MMHARRSAPVHAAAGISGDIPAAVASWAAAQTARGHSPATRKLRTSTVRALYRHAGTSTVEDLTGEHVTAYLARPGLAVNTRRAYAVSIAAWCQWAGLALTVDVPRGATGLPRPARRAGIDAAMLAAPPPVDAWIACGRWAGLRAGEVARLRADDVDLLAGWLRVEGKGGQLGAVPLHPRLRAVLAPYVEAAAGGALWPVRPETVSGRAGVLLRAHAAARRFHELRHYFGTEVYRDSRDVLRAQRALRHASPATTTIYAQLVDDELVAAVATVR